MNDLLDGKPIVVQRGEHWCCLLCLRQFESEAKVCKHLSKSALHTDNLSAALAEGRVQQPRPEEAPPAGAKRLAAVTASAEEPPSKRRVAEPPVPVEPAPSSGGMSALEQMELFEKRLKVQAKRLPEKDEEESSRPIDSSNARTINGQMDWECGYCGMFNFARVVSCGQCHKHVDKTTIYVRKAGSNYESLALSLSLPLPVPSWPSLLMCPLPLLRDGGRRSATPGLEPPQGDQVREVCALLCRR
jgi:hypothetical protein